VLLSIPKKLKIVGLNNGESFDRKVLKPGNSEQSKERKLMIPVLERIKRPGKRSTMPDANRRFVLIKTPNENFIEFTGSK
jgi:hypothetical protein